MKLNYMQLLSPNPIPIPQVGGVCSPRLRDIAALGYETYQHYLAVLLLTPRSYLALAGQEAAYDQLPEEERMRLSIFEILLEDSQNRRLVKDALDFFLEEPVTYSPARRCFVTGEQGSAGAVTAANYSQVCQLICQRNYIRSHQEDPSQVTSKKAREILQKLQKGRAQKARQSSANQDLELGNIISAVANRSSSLNMINIWDLTIYQLWDCFYRIANNQIYDIQSMSVAAWGNKNHAFDAASWYKHVEKL